LRTAIPTSTVVRRSSKDASKWWAARPFWVLILAGVFERHPALSYSIAENGAWWVPDIVKRMDEKWLGGHNTRKEGGRRCLKSPWGCRCRETSTC
jgi:hypothetical protein